VPFMPLGHRPGVGMRVALVRVGTRSSVTVTVYSPTKSSPVTSSSTPRPIRWKVCMSDLSSSLSV
jgi:hypothetical protein